MLDFMTRVRTAIATLTLGQIEAAGQPVLQQPPHFRGGKKIDDAWPPLGVRLLPRGEDIHDLGHIRERALAMLGGVRNALAEDAGESLMEGGRRQQIRDRSSEDDDMARCFFDLADALEIGNSGRKIFHANAKQRGDGDAQQFRKILERLDLDQLAALEPVDGGPRYAETSRDF